MHIFKYTIPLGDQAYCWTVTYILSDIALFIDKFSSKGLVQNWKFTLTLWTHFGFCKVVLVFKNRVIWLNLFGGDAGASISRRDNFNSISIIMRVSGTLTTINKIIFYVGPVVPPEAPRGRVPCDVSTGVCHGRSKPDQRCNWGLLLSCCFTTSRSHFPFCSSAFFFFKENENF